MIYFRIVLIIVFILIVYNLTRKKSKGAFGELKAASQLNRLQKNEYVVLNDVLFSTDYGSTQIDHVVISIYGVFVIETKNYGGWIHGDEKAEYWTQTIDKKKSKFRNPTKQNWAHIYALKEVLTTDKQVKYHSIVVFTGSAELKKITSETPVIYCDRLYKTIRAKSGTPVLTIQEVNIIYNELKEVLKRDSKAKREHVRQLKNNIQNQKQKESSLVCPRCGADLILRDGEYGKFYGCSNYPKCGFTQAYDEN